MRTILLALALAAVPLAEGAAQSPAMAPAPPRVCLRATDIMSTGVVDNQTIIFHMNNGADWKNTLQQECPGLKIAGSFVYVIAGGAVCANQQRIRVYQGPSVCFLGNFERVNPK